MNVLLLLVTPATYWHTAHCTPPARCLTFSRRTRPRDFTYPDTDQLNNEAFSSSILLILPNDANRMLFQSCKYFLTSN